MCAVDKACEPVVLSGIANFIYSIGLVIRCCLKTSAAAEAIGIHVVSIVHLTRDRGVGTNFSHDDACTLDVGAIYGVSVRCREYRIFVSAFTRKVLMPCLRAVSLAVVEQIADLAVGKLCGCHPGDAIHVVAEFVEVVAVCHRHRSSLSADDVAACRRNAEGCRHIGVADVRRFVCISNEAAALVGLATIDGTRKGAMIDVQCTIIHHGNDAAMCAVATYCRFYRHVGDAVFNCGSGAISVFVHGDACRILH